MCLIVSYSLITLIIDRSQLKLIFLTHVILIIMLSTQMWILCFLKKFSMNVSHSILAICSDEMLKTLRSGSQILHLKQKNGSLDCLMCSTQRS